MGSNFSPTKSKQTPNAVDTAFSFFQAMKKALIIKTTIFFFPNELDAAVQSIYSN